LRVLDATEEVRHDGAASLEYCQHLGVSAIADRVNGGRETTFEAAPHIDLEVCHRLQRKAAARRVIVRLEHPGRQRTERAVAEELDAADA